MRLLDDSINQKDPINLYKVGNVIKNGESAYFVIVKDSNLVLHKDNKFGLVLLENGRLQYHGGECWFDTEKELADAFYVSGDVLLTGKNTFDMD